MALALVVLLAPRQAAAGCGDYVTIGSRLISMPHELGAKQDGSHSSHQRPLGVPCRGPQCSQDPGQGIPPVPQTLTGPLQWLWWAGLRELLWPTLSRPYPDPSPPAYGVTAEGIFRPPRLRDIATH
ncbi:MAG: hypothetical protein K6T86_18860 [Pirellulales bacterium]|nr:hypothetical protein [Pirellulales bacterium]